MVVAAAAAVVVGFGFVLVVVFGATTAKVSPKSKAALALVLLASLVASDRALRLPLREDTSAVPSKQKQHEKKHNKRSREEYVVVKS